MRKYKVQRDLMTGEWHVLKKFMDQNSKFRWEIVSTHSFRSAAIEHREILETLQ